MSITVSLCWHRYINCGECPLYLTPSPSLSLNHIPAKSGYKKWEVSLTIDLRRMVSTVKVEWQLGAKSVVGFHHYSAC